MAEAVNPFYLKLQKDDLVIDIDLDTPGWRERWSGFLERPFRAVLVSRTQGLAITMEDGSYVCRTFATIPASRQVKCYGLVAPSGESIWSLEGTPVVCTGENLTKFARELLRAPDAAALLPQA